MVLIEALDAAGAAAVPAETTRELDGWIVRHSEGLSIKRANSVYPRRSVDGGFDDAVAFCESYYSERRLPTRFQVSPVSQPARIKERLLERGYRVQSPTAVYVCDLSELGPPVSPGEMTVDLTPIATAAWWSTSIAALEIEPGHQPATERLYERITADTAFVRVARDGVGCGVGMGVLAGDQLGVFDIATVTGHRRQGVGRFVVDALMRWALQGGARMAYLQVETRNEVAVSLYRRAGFQTHAYTYEYLTKDGSA